MRSSKAASDSVRAANQSDTPHVGTTELGKSEIVFPAQRRTKAKSNRENSHSSTGPKTPRGKRYSSRNARKHDLYSKELLISEADMPEFEEMRSGLEEQLRPHTVLRRLAFDDVVACQWRVKLALRLESMQFARQLEHEKPQNESGEAVQPDPVIERWYGSSRLDLHAGIRLLEHSIDEFKSAGDLHDDTKKLLGLAFGVDFVPGLEEWNTMSKDAMLLADHLVRHRETFGDIPDADVKQQSPPGEPPRVVTDPMQGQHMVVKLLELRIHFLKNLLMITSKNTLARPLHTEQCSEFNPRFLANTTREWRRALDWYLSLEDRGL